MHMPTYLLILWSHEHVLWLIEDHKLGFRNFKCLLGKQRHVILESINSV